MKRTMMALGFLLSGFLVGCHDSVDYIATRLDTLGKRLDQYGTVSVSSPLFADSDYAQEIFAVDVPADSLNFKKFYDDARSDVQARAGAIFQQAKETRTGFQLFFDLQQYLLNKIKLDRFTRAERRHRRSQAFGDAAQVLRLILPGIDPDAAAALDAFLASQPDGDNSETSEQGQPQPNGDASGASATQPPVTGNDEEDTADDAATEPSDDPATPDEDPGSKNGKEDPNPFVELYKALLAGSLGKPPDLPDLKPVEPREFAKDLLPNLKEVKEVLAGEAKFEKFQALLSQMGTTSAEPIVPNRSALITAAGDKAVLGIMQFLGKPKLAERFRDKIVLIGVCMVSCAPGTKTTRGYMADVSVAVGYDCQPVRHQLLDLLIEQGDRHTADLIEVFIRLKNDELPADLRSSLDGNARRRAELSQEQARLGEQLEGISGQEEKSLVVKRLEGIMRQLDELEQESESLSRSYAHRRVFEQLSNPTIDTYRRHRRSRAPAYLAGQVLSDVYDVDTFTGDLLSSSANAVVPPAPTVAAVSPMTDVQALDLASSIRQQQAFALKLALFVAGYGTEAQYQQVSQFIEQVQQDAASRTPLNTVAAYSNSGGVFGYQIGPSFVGLANMLSARRVGGAGEALKHLLLGRIRPGPAMILQRQSFPALVFVGIDRDDLRLKLRHDRETDTWTIVEPRLQFRQTTRWIPFNSGLTEERAGRGGIGERDRVLWANELRAASNAVDHLDFSSIDNHEDGDIRWRTEPNTILDSPSDAAFKDFLRSRIAVLRSHLLEAYHFQAVPMEAFLPPPIEQPAE